MIFGNNGKHMTKMGCMDLFNDGSMQTHVGNSIFSKNSVSQQSGNMLMHGNGGGMSVKMGNTFMTPKGSWTRIGNTLFGPNGQTFSGVHSDDDVWSIINHETH